MKSLECAQSNIVKNIMGFNKRSHHSNLLHAVRIDKVETSVIRGILSLWYRIYQVDNPARVLSDAMLCDYINSRHLIPGTFIHSIHSCSLPSEQHLSCWPADLSPGLLAFPRTPPLGPAKHPAQDSHRPLPAWVLRSPPARINLG